MVDSVNIRILVVEDQENDFLILKEKVAGWNEGLFSLDWAVNLQDGLAKCREHLYEVVLLDRGLPDSDGLQGLQQFGRQFPHLPVILMTGLSDENLGLEAVRSGAQDYLVKGQIDSDLIRRVIQYAIERKRVLAMKDHFVNLVSHELRAPLYTLKEISRLLLTGEIGPVSEKQKEMLIMNGRTIDRMLRTANNLLELARFEVRKMPLRKTKFDLTHLIHEVSQSFRLPMLTKGIHFSESFQSEPCEVEADRDKIAQVLTNLIHNALKFTQSGFIKVLLLDRPQGIECRVADSGEGMVAEDCARVFNKYEQFGRTAGGTEKGTGLGLAICKEIIEMHQGTIDAESEKGKGSVFYFTLPRPKEEK